MKHKVKNGNKLCTKIFTMLLACSLLFAGMSSAALAVESENLIGTKYTIFDPTFETGTGKLDLTKGAVPDENGGHGENGEHDTAGQSLKLPLEGNTIKFEVPVEPATNYTFSFWMKNSVADALKMTYVKKDSNYFHMKEPEDREIGHSYLNDDYDWNGYEFSPIFNDMTFGSEHTVTADMNTWRQVSINFTSPYQGIEIAAVLAFACAKDDPYLAVDDLKLVATGKAPNRVSNGYVEALRYDKEPVSATNLSATSAEIETKDGNTYFKTTAANASIYFDKAFFFKGKDLGTRYKISAKYMPEDETKTDNRFYFRIWNEGTSKGTYAQPLYSNSKEWHTYTMYVDATKAAALGVPFTERGIGTYHNNPGFIDDLYSWYDESNIGFYKELELHANNGDRYLDLVDNTYSAKGTEYAAALTDVLMFERSVEASSISDLPENRTLKVRAHYLPKAKWGTGEDNATTVSFDKTDVTLLSAVYVYKTDETGKKIESTKTLVSVDIDSATSSENGETIDVVGEVTVPEAKDGVTYQVEAMAWDMNSMKPIMDKQVLN